MNRGVKAILLFQYKNIIKEGLQMYREEIEAYMKAHTQEMVEDICELCRINSEKMPRSEEHTSELQSH